MLEEDKKARKAYDAKVNRVFYTSFFSAQN
jgi:hypothetical protein